MAVIPSEDRLFVRLAESASKVGSIHVPDQAKKPPVSGVVTSVGPGIECKHCGKPKPTNIQVGWTVYFNESAGYDLVIKGESLRVIRFSDIGLYDDEPVKS